jgi:hypothetical protein
MQAGARGEDVVVLAQLGNLATELGENFGLCGVSVLNVQRPPLLWVAFRSWWTYPGTGVPGSATPVIGYRGVWAIRAALIVRRPSSVDG